MKLKISTPFSIILAYLSSHANAGLSKIMAELNELMLGFQDAAPTLRALSPSTIAQLQNYGCWCYFEDEHGHGRGQAVDEVDKCCHDLANGYDCAIMDSNGACIPWEVGYVSGIGGGTEQIASRCETFNPSECAQIACKVEGLFVQRMFEQIFSNTGVDPAYHNSNFDAASECVTIVGGGPADKECCGLHPFRKPFHTRGGVNACCADVTANAKIYNTLSHDCCFDGEVRDIC